MLLRNKHFSNQISYKEVILLDIKMVYSLLYIFIYFYLFISIIKEIYISIKHD